MMIRKGLDLCIIVSLLAFGLPTSAAAGSGLPPPGRTVSLSANGVAVTWQTPPLQSTRLADGTSVLSMDGFDSVQTPGSALLPQDSLLVALPPDANPALDVQVVETVQLPAPALLGQAPATVTVPRMGGEQMFDLSQTLAQDTAPVTLEEIGVMRGIRLARLSLRPVRLEGEWMQVIRKVKVAIQFGSSWTAFNRLSPELISRDATLSALSAEVVNPSQLALSAPQNPSSLTLVDRAGQAAIEVSRPGLTAVTWELLSNAGFPVGAINPHFLHLEQAGVELATEWVGDDDAVFEPGEQLLFYAQPRFSRWTARDVYFVSVNATPRKQMPERTVNTTGKPAGTLWMDQLFEQNKIYTPDCYCAPIPAGRDGDRWVWDVLRKPDRISASYPLDLTAVDNTRPAEITLWLIGFTDVNLTSHSVQVQMHGMLLGTLVFAGKQLAPPGQATLTIPPGILQSNNTLTLSLAADGVLVDGVWLDAFSVHYARDGTLLTSQLAAAGSTVVSQYLANVTSTTGLQAYDVTDRANPVRLLGVLADSAHAVLADPTAGLPRRYALVPAGAINTPDIVRMVIPLQPLQGADYIIITPPEFSSDAAQLVSLRQSQGLKVAVEDVRAIYDAADGRPLPEAIQAYLANAYAHWKPQPAYVLLVGDGTSDPRNYRGSSSQTWIPPFLADVDPVIGEAAADNRYVMVDGSDNLPDMWIGRLPVNSHVEAAITITKIVQYDLHPAPGAWSQSMVLVSDKNDPKVGNFSTENSALAAAYGNERYAITQLEADLAPSQPEFHQTVLSYWNQGNGLILYNGHASTQQWGADVMFHLNDLPSLLNGNRLPVLLEMTCLTSSFQVPDIPTLDETLLRRSGKGVVAALGSTGLGLSSGHMLFARGFLDQIMADPNNTLGKAAALAKLKVITASPALGYLVDTFTLLGDPAMRINYRYTSYLPAVEGRKP